jgi:pimeloyl-ACP methyl ester carboxylesterase
MYAATLGEGAPVVLLHGYGVSGSYMLPLPPALPGWFSVYVPDLPRQGAASRGPERPGSAASPTRSAPAPRRRD